MQTFARAGLRADLAECLRSDGVVDLLDEAAVVEVS
jgi:hypothetical protein